MNSGKRHLEYAGIAFIGLIALLEHVTGIELILFPTLAAMSHEVVGRPSGKSATAPAQIILTPLITACMGIAVSRWMHFGTAAILLETGLAIAVIRFTRSPISPAISVGLLPIFLDVTSWLYPITITVGTNLLAICSLVQRIQLDRPRDEPGQHLPPCPGAASKLGAPWHISVPVYGVVVAGLAYLATASGERMIMYPPLAVIGFEMFTRPATCPWIGQPWKLPVAATIAALGGSLSVMLLGAGELAATGAMTLGLVTLRGLNLDAPPVLAVCMLPLVMHHVGLNIVVAVALGTTLMAVSFIAWRHVPGVADRTWG